MTDSFAIDARIDKELSNGGIRTVEVQPWFDLLEQRLPVGFNRISWEDVPRHLCIPVLDSPRQIASDELEILLANLSPQLEAWFRAANVRSDDEVVWIGDTSEVGLRMSAAKFLTYFPILMSLPQHSYALPVLGDWCLNYVMEGQLFFTSKAVSA